MPEVGLRVAPHVRRGEWRMAIWKLHWIEAGEAGKPNPVVRNSVLSALKVARRWFEALEIFSAVPTRLLFNVAATTLAACKAWQGSALLLQQMFFLALLPDIVNINSAMNIFKDQSQWRQALNLFTPIAIAGLQADVVTRNTCIAACQPNAWQKSLQLADAQLDAAGAAALLAYEAHWRWTQALELFWRLAEMSIQLSMQLFTQAINICEKHKQWSSAMTLLPLGARSM
eukprot:symbB.v1.2.006847.t1/scaffold408.1/size210514/5